MMRSVLALAALLAFTVGAGAAFACPSHSETKQTLASVDGSCVVDFEISPTRIPAQQIEGSTDTRPLGVHFGAFVYHRPA